MKRDIYLMPPEREPPLYNGQGRSPFMFTLFRSFTVEIERAPLPPPCTACHAAFLDEMLPGSLDLGHT